MSSKAQLIRPNFPSPDGMAHVPTAHTNVPENPLGRLDHAALAITVAADGELFDQDAPVRHGYHMTSGCLRTVRLMEDGRRLIDRFLLPGDLLGFAAGTHHDVSAQAVTPTTLRRTPIQAIINLAEHDTVFARFLWHVAAVELRAAHDHALLLGRQTAIERVANFLRDMAARLPNVAAGRFSLPMGRADIADHLGLTVETVSRTLTQLRCQGVIAVELGRISIREGATLAALAGAADTCPHIDPRQSWARH